MTWLVKKRIHQIDLFLKYPHEVQNETLMKLLTSAKSTDWGKNFEYASLARYGQYKQRVPVQDYESLKPYINRLRQGEQNILWHSEIKWFAKSSGTTDKSKFIPVSREALDECQFKGGKDIFPLFFKNYPDSDIFSGKALTLGGSHQINSFSNQSYYGDLSAVIIQNLPFWAHINRLPEKSIALSDKFERKIDLIAEKTISENVTKLVGVPSWMMVLLQRVLTISGKKNLTEVWPLLELFIHGGVAFSPYREQYKNLIPSEKMHYMDTYNASEGFFAIQDRKEPGDMLLMLDYGIFYEFIPDEEFHSEQPDAIPLNDVVKGKNYAMVISTNAGLWRYNIGDTVRFTSLDPYRIEITGRTKHFINAFGEEMIIDNAEKALATACNKSGATIKEYTAAPVYMEGKNAGAHEWLIEFVHRPDDLLLFINTLDRTLKELNSDYEAKRRGNMTLCAPVIREMPANTFYNWLKEKNKLGGQHKVPRLNNDRKIVEEILECQRKNNK